MEDAVAAINDLTKNGCAIGVGNFQNGKVKIHSTYRKDWQDLYNSKRWITRDPIVSIGIRTTGTSEWPAAGKSTVLRAANDFGISTGVTISNAVAGSRCIVGLSLTKPLSKAENAEILSSIQKSHIWHLVAQTETLTDTQIDLVSLFANGLRAKQVAAYFNVSEEAIKQRKIVIQQHLGVNNFLVVVNLCAMAGKTVPRIS